MKPFGFIQTLQNRFPDFKLSTDESDLPTVVFAFFCTYIESALKSEQDSLIKNIIEYLSDLVDSGDPIIESCLDEIALGISEKRNEFLDQARLTDQKLYERLIKTIIKWKSV